MSRWSRTERTLVTSVGPVTIRGLSSGELRSLSLEVHAIHGELLEAVSSRPVDVDDSTGSSAQDARAVVFQHKVVRRGLVDLTPPSLDDMPTGLRHLIATGDGGWGAGLVYELYSAIFEMSDH